MMITSIKIKRCCVRLNIFDIFCDIQQKRKQHREKLFMN